jgi:hypothetical protein
MMALTLESDMNRYIKTKKSDMTSHFECVRQLRLADLIRYIHRNHSKETTTESMTWGGVPLDRLTNEEREEMMRQWWRKENSLSNRRSKYGE